jgi:hypothetical protein
MLALVAAPAMAEEDQISGSPKLAVSIAPGSAAAADAVSPDQATPAPDPQAPATPPAPTPAEVAAKQDSATMSFFRDIEFSGFVDTYYLYNFNKTNPALRNFDITNNSFSLNLAEIALEKKPTSDSRGGFRIDLDYGPTATLVHSFEPTGAATSRTFDNIEQAYVSYLAPAGSGLQFDAGLFVTPFGQEVIESKDNWNYSRSLLFTLAIPYYHMGVRTTYSPNDKVTLTGFVVNGWNNAVDNNTGKTLIGQIMVKPTDKLMLMETFGSGPEQNNTNTGFRNLSDSIITYNPTKMVSLAANGDYGKDNATSQTWWGVAGYLRYQANDWFALTPRFEYLDDKNGFMTGVVQKPKEGTVTFEFKDKGGVIMRAEYRHDFSDVPFYVKSTGAVSKSQDTVSVGVIYVFTTKAQ